MAVDSMKRLLCLCCCIFAGSAVVLGQPIEVGSVYPTSIRSDQLQVQGGVRWSDHWEVEVHHPGATYIALHFAKFDLPPGEEVVISDAQGGQSYTLTGKGKMGLGRFWAQHVKGDRAVLRFYTWRGHPTGFVIDQYAAGFTDWSYVPESICGVNDKQNAVCFEGSHPTEYNRSRAVARLLISGFRLCTGWLASANNHLVTNEHCITSATAAANTDYEFMAEADQCSDANCQLCHPGTIHSGATFIQDNPGLDYALVQITSGDPAATFGYLEIDDREAVLDEQIYIPQHPGGRAKELGIESSDSANPGGVCEVDGFGGPCTGSGYLDVGYRCDTEGGSSGSPVLAVSSQKVIALHHCGDECPPFFNLGVPINLICDEICAIIDPACTLPDDDLILTDHTVIDDEIHESCVSIATGPGYKVSGSGELTLRTRQRVALRAGTSVEPGGILHVILDPTTGTP